MSTAKKLQINYPKYRSWEVGTSPSYRRRNRWRFRRSAAGS